MIDRELTIADARKELARLVSEEIFLALEVEAKTLALADMRSAIKTYRFVLGIPQ